MSFRSRSKNDHQHYGLLGVKSLLLSTLIIFDAVKSHYYQLLRYEGFQTAPSSIHNCLKSNRYDKRPTNSDASEKLLTLTTNE